MAFSADLKPKRQVLAAGDTHVYGKPSSGDLRPEPVVAVIWTVGKHFI